MSNTLHTPYGDFSVNIKKSPVDFRDYIAESILGDGDLPEEYTTRYDLMPVRNQGSQGSCLAQAAACMKEWQELKDIDFDDYMSPQFVFNNRQNQHSDGMYTRDVMKILHNIGICPESVYPYGNFDEIAPEIFEIAKNHVIKSYASINTIEGLKQAIYRNGPCIIAVPVYNYGSRMWNPEFDGQVMIGGHALSVTGWTVEGFELRNSWGDKWSDDGYTMLPWKDWGMQWEVWTTIDDNSPKKLPKAPWYKKTWNSIKKILLRVIDIVIYKNVGNR